MKYPAGSGSITGKQVFNDFRFMFDFSRFTKIFGICATLCLDEFVAKTN